MTEHPEQIELLFVARRRYTGLDPRNVLPVIDDSQWDQAIDAHDWPQLRQRCVRFSLAAAFCSIKTCRKHQRSAIDANHREIAINKLPA